MTTNEVTLDTQTQTELLYLAEVEQDLLALEDEAEAFTYTRTCEL